MSANTITNAEKFALAVGWLSENPSPNPPIIGLYCEDWPRVEAHDCADFTTARHGDSRDPRPDWERAPQTMNDWEREAMGT